MSTGKRNQQYVADWRLRNQEKRAAHRRREGLKKFNLTVEQYDAILESQGGVCRICGKVCLTGRRLAVDHDHRTNHNRGLLCMNCNQGLGRFQDNPQLLREAAAYLEEELD